MTASKIITLDDHFYTGEPTVQLVSTWGRGHRLLKEATSLHKIASTNSPSLDYINSIEPEEGKTIVLVIGLGDYETYGDNRNGDAFPSRPIRNKIAAHEVLTKHYQTYDKAHVFQHHINDDPEKAVGRVKKAFWNPFMRRVEIVEDFDNDKMPHLLEKIASGEYPAKSMGCRIKYDVCTKCGNRARTRKDYCDDLKYEMGRIDPYTGIKNAALNPSPDFFDSSWVIRPADRTGYMLKKVAKEHPYEIRMGSFELGDQVTSLQEKAADIGKSADIEKIIHGEPISSVSNLAPEDARLIERYMDSAPESSAGPGVDDKAVSVLISYKPSQVMGTANDSGSPIDIKELLQYFLGKLAPEMDASIPEDIYKCANDHLGVIYEVYHKYPRFLDEMQKAAGIQDAAFCPELAVKLAYGESPTTDYFKRKLLSEDFYPQRGKTDMMSWTDPNTGQQYSTNYGEAQRVNDTLIRRGLKQKAFTSGSLMGTGALLGGAAYAARKTNVPKNLRTTTGLLGAGLGLLGAKKLFDPTPISGPKVVTDQGETISGWTPMMPVQKFGSDLDPLFDYVIKRANFRPHQLKNAQVQRLFNALKEAEIHDELSGYIGPTLDLEKTAQAIGNSILKQ